MHVLAPLCYDATCEVSSSSCWCCSLIPSNTVLKESTSSIIIPTLPTFKKSNSIVDIAYATTNASTSMKTTAAKTTMKRTTSSLPHPHSIMTKDNYKENRIATAATGINSKDAERPSSLK